MLLEVNCNHLSDYHEILYTYYLKDGEYNDDIHFLKYIMPRL